MTFGLPEITRPYTISAALARGASALALSCHVAAALILLAILAGGSQSTGPVVLGLLALVPAVLGLLVLHRHPSRATAALYLVVGAISTWLFCMALMTDLDLLRSTSSLLLTLPRVALMLVGGARAAGGWRVLWCTAGAVIAEAVIVVAAVTEGVPLRFDFDGAVAYAVIVATLLLLGRSQRRSRSVRPHLVLAERDERLAALRSGMEARAAAVLHDTVLGDLAALGASADGRMSPAMRERMRGVLAAAQGGDWLTAAPERALEPGRLTSAVARADAAGVRVDLGGDTVELERLAPAAAEALDAAVAQCLVNVGRHAGVDRAEVVVFGSPDAVTVMVIDSGRGFEIDDVPGDRLGLRNSVHGRIEAVGGSVRVWTAPDRGTSVVLSVPTEAVPR
jgi:hypothetical protein